MKDYKFAWILRNGITTRLKVNFYKGSNQNVNVDVGGKNVVKNKFVRTKHVSSEIFEYTGTKSDAQLRSYMDKKI